MLTKGRETVKITNRDRNKIEGARGRKERTLEKVKDILRVICQDNPDTFKKAPEGRIKTLDSIEKGIKQTVGCNVDNFERHVRDVAGARIICCTLDEIPKAESLIRRHPGVRKCKVLRKYEDSPDPDGYRGHHLEITVDVFYKNKTIKDTCEIQIRTLAGDLWAVLSHRDFYKVPRKPPLSVRKDMLTLSKQLEVVDELAMSLKQRIRDEINKEVREKPKKKLAERDMLTPENIVNLIHKTFKEKVSIDFAYQVVQHILSHDVVSLKRYKTLITSPKYRNIIEDIFAKFDVRPQLEDYLCAPIELEVLGIGAGKRSLVEIAKERRELTVVSVEKGVDIRREELDKEAKISQPTSVKEEA